MGVDFQKARDTTYSKLFARLPGERTTLTTSTYNGPENSPLVADYNRQQHRLTLANDSVITCDGTDRSPESILSDAARLVQEYDTVVGRSTL